MFRVGGYDVLDTIGHGTYSTVKKVRERATGKTYVAKIVAKTQANAQNQVDAEILALLRIKHRNVIGLKEVLQSKNHFYIILEMAAGGDLCDRVVAPPGSKVTGMAVDQIRSILTQLTEGLLTCHLKGIAHRDIKPENVMLTETNDVKIADFGLAHLRAAETPEGTDSATEMVGTLVYAAPEVLSGRYDPYKADIWSLGCTLYVMATGYFPFPVRDQSKHLQRLHKPMDPLPKNTSPELHDLLSKLLTVDPKKRITLPEVLKHPYLSSATLGERRVSCVVESTAARSTRSHV